MMKMSDPAPRRIRRTDRRKKSKRFIVESLSTRVLTVFASVLASALLMVGLAIYAESQPTAPPEQIVELEDAFDGSEDMSLEDALEEDLSEEGVGNGAEAVEAPQDPTATPEASQPTEPTPVPTVEPTPDPTPVPTMELSTPI